LKKFFGVLAIAAMGVVLWQSRVAVQAEAWQVATPEPPAPVVVSPCLASGDLLLNGNMNTDADTPQERFYWRPTNHFVAGSWYEWWMGDNLPEFIDGGHPHHNACYPPPAPGGLCHDSNNGSQGYIRWGGIYMAGVYQPVKNVTPCVLYQFSAWNRNDAVDYYTKVGISPTGWVQPAEVSDNPPYNCPPDGVSKCPDPKLEAESDFPTTMVWSPKIMPPALTWQQFSVTAEALANTISVWTYAAPQTSGSMSSYWDETSLVAVPFPNGRLPNPSSWVPSGFIYNVQPITMTPGTLTINWTTISAGSTQVWYEVRHSSPSITSTAVYSYYTYFPIIMNSNRYDRHTLLNAAPVTEHQASITGLVSGDQVRFVVASRRVYGGACQTEVSLPWEVNIP